MELNLEEAINDLAMQLAQVSKAAAIHVATIAALKRENAAQAAKIAELSKPSEKQE